MKVSRPTARKWVRRYLAQGQAGLADRPATAHRRPHRLSPEREQAILERRDTTLEGPHPIGWKLGENPATVHRMLARHGRPRLWELDVATRQVVPYGRDRPGEWLRRLRARTETLAGYFTQLAYRVDTIDDTNGGLPPQASTKLTVRRDPRPPSASSLNSSPG